ncbi:MAG: PEGA domain-containing protein [Bradymonadaceae bacterium]
MSDNVDTLLVRTVVCVILAAAAVVSPSDGRASSPEQGRQLVVLELGAEGRTGGLSAKLTEVLQAEVEASEAYRLVGREPVALSDVAVILGCRTIEPRCLSRAADHFGASYVLFGRVRHRTGETYQVEIKLFDSEGGSFAGSFEQEVEGAKPPFDAFRRRVRELLDSGDGDETTRLHVGANVRGAEVRIDGEPEGRAPVTVEGLEPGEHRVEVAREGYHPWQTSVRVESGARVQLQASLEEKAEPAAAKTEKPPPARSTPEDDSVRAGGGAPPSRPEPPTSPTDRDASGMGPVAEFGPWAVLGAGGGMLIASLVKGLDVREANGDLRRWRQDHPRAAQRDGCVGRECNIIERGRRSQLTHRVLLGLGTAAVAGSVVWFILRGDGGRERAERETPVSFGPNGVSLTW